MQWKVIIATRAVITGIQCSKASQHVTLNFTYLLHGVQGVASSNLVAPTNFDDSAHRESLVGSQLAVRAQRVNLRKGSPFGLDGEHQAREIADGQRPAEVETLVLVAADRAQELELLRRLDALGDDLEMQAVCERYDRLHDRRIVGTGGDFIDEARS